MLPPVVLGYSSVRFMRLVLSECYEGSLKYKEPSRVAPSFSRNTTQVALRLRDGINRIDDPSTGREGLSSMSANRVPFSIRICR